MLETTACVRSRDLDLTVGLKIRLPKVDLGLVVSLLLCAVGCTLSLSMEKEKSGHGGSS